mgnify:CR=1 FL=1
MGNRKKKVLAVDNDPEFLIAIERFLEEEGFDTTTTWNTCEVPVLVAARHFDLVLIGNHPPEINPADILRRLNSTGAQVPCIVLDSVAQHPFEAQALSSLGAYAVVCKGQSKQLAGVIRECVHASRGDLSKHNAAAAN